MDYETACSSTVTREEVILELAKHSASLSELDTELGVRDTYSGQEILDWLGY